MSKRLLADQAAVVVIDWQERLFAAMPEHCRDRALGQAANLTWLAGQLGMPVVASEQYPRGLGPSIEQVGVHDPVEKLCFSAMEEPAFAERLAATGRRQVLLTGMETHVCVAQTCRDLLDQGYAVWVVVDACLSRRKLDWKTGTKRMRADGAAVVTTEAVMFELIGRAGTPLFKEVSRRIK